MSSHNKYIYSIRTRKFRCKVSVVSCTTSDFGFELQIQKKWLFWYFNTDYVYHLYETTYKYKYNPLVYNSREYWTEGTLVLFDRVNVYLNKFLDDLEKSEKRDRELRKRLNRLYNIPIK